VSKLAELVQSMAAAATPATAATQESESSRSSNSSRGAPLTLTLSPEFEQRIRAMAQRWQYSPEELADVLERAQRDPAGWTRAVELDERREEAFRQCGALPRADA
jgi:hypothetical protein